MKVSTYALKIPQEVKMKGVVAESIKDRIWTYEGYLRGEIPPEVSEVVEGKEVRKMPTGGLHGWLEGMLYWMLSRALRQNFYVLVGEVALLLSRSPLTLLGADIVVISRERLKTLPEGAVEIPPDLIVEIVSPSERVPYVLKKMEDYRRWGVKRQVWVFPADEEVVIITSEGLESHPADEEVALIGNVKFKLSELLKEVKDEAGGSRKA